MKPKKRRAGTNNDRTQRLTTRVGKVLTRMRDGASLAQASQEVGVDPRTVERLAGSALLQDSSGRYKAHGSDTVQRELRMPAPDGVRDVTVRDSKQATLVGEYWNEVHTYLVRGDASGLTRFAQARVTDATGERIPFVVDSDTLDELGNAGVLSFETDIRRGR